MASSSTFNSQHPSTPGPFAFGSPAPHGSSQQVSQQYQSSAIDPQLNMTPSRQSLSKCVTCTPFCKPLTRVSLPSASQQTFSLPPPPPAQPPRQIHNESSSSFDSRFDYQDTAELDINPSFIDALSQSMGFNEVDEEYRKGLHAFPRVCHCVCPSSQH